VTKNSPCDFIKGIGEKGRLELEKERIYTIEEMARASNRTRFNLISSDKFLIAEKIVRSLRLEKQGMCESVRRLSNRMSDPDLLENGPFFEKDLPNTISLVGQIGVGSFASVYEGIHCERGTRTKIAIKCFDLRRVLRGEMNQIRDGILREAKLQKQLKHERIVRLYEIVDASPRHVSFILEMCHGGDLLTRVQENGPYNESDAMIVMGNVFSALQYMHQLNICHRDIKLENVLMKTRKSNTDVKLADFGTARVMAAQHLASTFSGTRYTMAPEVLRCDEISMGRLSLEDRPTKKTRKKYDGRCADIYSCGVVLFTIMKASYPKNQNEVKICSDSMMTSRGGRLLLKLMDPNPRNRPTALDASQWISSSSLPPGLKKVSSGKKKPRQRHKTPPRSALKAMRKDIVDDDNGDGGHDDDDDGVGDADGGVCCVQ